MRTLALFLLSSLVASSGGSGAAPPVAIRSGVIVVASDRTDLDLVARPLAGGAERVLVGGLDSPHSPAVSPDGRTVVFAVDSRVQTDLVALDLESGDRRALSNDARYEQAPAFSPDGSEIAYVSSRGCGQGDRNCDRLAVLSLAEGRSRVVLTGDRIFDPAWSPDGRRIAFVTGNDVLAVSSGGGEPDTIAAGSQYRHPSWSPDGRRIVVERQSGSFKSPPSLHVLDVATRRVSPLYGFSGVAPVWLASGRIRFVGAGSDLFDVNPDGTGRVRVTRGGGLSADWAQSSADVVYTRDVGGRSMLYELGDDGSVSRRLSERDATLPSLSPDGRSVAFVARAARTSAVYVLPTAGGTARKVATTPRAITSKPSWSPDGKRIALEVRGGIATVAATGGVVTHVRGTVRDDQSPAWAPGGREIAFVRFRRTTGLNSHDVWAANLRTGRIRVVARDARDPAWSPDGRSIAFSSDRTTFESTIWTARSDGTARTRRTGGSWASDFGPVWSPDGRYLAFVRSDEGPSLGGLWLKPVGGGVARRIVAGELSFTWGPRPVK
jgi:Tol biopolymer transport system component